MASIRTITASVLEQFPDDWHVIVDLCGTDEDFRELCDHYTECSSVLARLRSEQSPEPQLVAEYEDLIDELEQEIRRIVDTTDA